MIFGAEDHNRWKSLKRTLCVVSPNYNLSYSMDGQKKFYDLNLTRNFWGSGSENQGER